MKKARDHFIFLFVAISAVVNAQIDINSPDFIPIGRTFTMAFDTLSHQPGNAGANQIWNFSGLQSPFLDTLQVGHPNSTPYSSYFPSANASISSPTAAYYQYFSNISTGFYILGAVVVTSPNPPYVSTFHPPSKYFQWPMNYSDTFTDSYINISIYPSIGPNGADTSKYISHYQEQNLVDGWGKITTPLGTFDCLRQKKIQSRTDSSWYFSSQTGTWSFINTYTDTNIIYDWLSNDIRGGFLLAEIGYNQTSQTYSGVYWMKNSIAGVNNHDNSPAISIYPNPAGNILHVETTYSGVIELLDMNGKVLRQLKPDREDHSLDVSEFNNGIYMLIAHYRASRTQFARRKIIIAK